MNTPKLIRVEKYQHQPTLAEATVGLTQLTNGRFMVTRSLPAGMDICPDAWRFHQETAAWKKFTDCTQDLESKGFNCVRRADPL